MNRLKEADVGITEYINKHEGFSGVIKQRYADFHVNEIDSDGNIVSLTTTVPPKIEVEHADKDQVEDHLKLVVSSDVCEKIKELTSQNEESSNDVEIEVTGMSKDDRKNLHTAIKAFGGGKLVSNTEQKEEKKFIVISRHNSKVKSERRSEWPAAYGGNYVHFVLFKENMDTMETVNLIASKLRIKPNMITYSGTKDRRGMTSQMMSVFRVNPKTLSNLSSCLRGVSFGNYSFKTKGLSLGDLRGNCFRIVLRNVTGSDEQILQSMQSLTEKGFLNYYGLQRFGCSISVPTHAIGKALLQGNWKLAVDLILKPRDKELNHSLAKARKIWWETHNAASALKVLPNKEKLIEGKLLLGLSKCGANDYINALEKIPWNTRLLYLHSYQSLIWNKVVSRRIKELGLKPLSGDLVSVNDAQTETVNDEVGEEEHDNTDKFEKKTKVRVISEEDLDNVSIHDIVMPLPGHDVMYPQNIMKDWYEDLLKSDGLSSANLKQNVRKYSVGGTYRKIVIRPDNLSWKTMHYSDPQKTLESSDVEKMRNMEAPQDEQNGIYKALILKFCLPSSTYATMALREILKSDTSSQHQASLNDYHVKKPDEVTSSAPDETNLKPQTTDPSGEASSDLNDTDPFGVTSSDLNDTVTESTEEVNHKEVSDESKSNESVKKEPVLQQTCGAENENCTESRKREGSDANGEVEEKKIKLETV